PCFESISRRSAVTRVLEPARAPSSPQGTPQPAGPITPSSLFHDPLGRTPGPRCSNTRDLARPGQALGPARASSARCPTTSAWAVPCPMSQGLEGPSPAGETSPMVVREEVLERVVACAEEKRAPLPRRPSIPLRSQTSSPEPEPQ